MQELFTFLDNPYLVVLGDSLQSLPGIERVDLLFYNAENAKTELHSIQREKNNQQAFQLDFNRESLDTFNAFRRKQNSQNWLGINNIPYSSKQSTDLKQNLFSEMDSYVLCLSFPNSTDFSKDVFLFYFRKNTSDFGLSLNDKVLSTSNKAIIGHLVYNSIKSQLNTIKHNQQSLRLLNEQTRYILDSKHQAELENINLKMRNKGNLIQLTEFLINELSNNSKDIFYLSEESKEHIGEFSGSVFELKKQLSRAMMMAKTLNFGIGKSEHILKTDYFNFSSSMETQIPLSTSETLFEENAKHTHSKTYDFLNDMEQSAQMVIKLGWKLTSANVGHQFEKPITASAISDKLKHHNSRIIKLLEQYPAKWSLIRNRFKPLQNVIVKAENIAYEQAG